MTSGEINLDPAERHRQVTCSTIQDQHFPGYWKPPPPTIEDAASSKPWGTDTLGSAFAKNYLESAAQLLEIWKSAADRTTQLGAEVVTAVDSSMATDDAAAHRVSATSAHPDPDLSAVSSDHDIHLWNAAADRYTQNVTGVDDSFYRRLSPFLWRVLGNVAGKRLLDLGCGHGWLAEQLRLAGATVTGIDGSTALLRHASTSYPQVAFTAHDLTSGLPHPLQTYHGVVAHMVLMDLPDLQPLIADIRDSLTPEGVFVFSILHPCFFAQQPAEDATTGERYRMVTGYLHHERRWVTSFGGHRHYHRPLSWYIELLASNHLVVTGLHEPPTLPAHRNPETEWTDYERWFATIPTMLAIACRPDRS